MTSSDSARSYRWLFWLLVVAGLAGDQVSKYAIFSRLYHDGHGGTIALWPGYFNISVAQFGRPIDDDGSILNQLRSIGGIRHWPFVNQGALFGVGQGQNLVFGAVSLLAAVFIISWSLREAVRGDLFLSASLGLILAGALGNCYDRIVFGGVRDFLHWYKWYDWPVFNIADVCLVIGAGMLLLEAFFRKHEEQTAVSAAKT